MPLSGALRVAVVTVSDRASRGLRDDRTGPELVTVVEKAGHCVHDTRVIADGEDQVARAVLDLAHDHDVVLLAGGTGIGPRDRTPEGVEVMCDVMVPGIGEAIRAASRARVTHEVCVCCTTAPSPQGRGCGVRLWGSCSHMPTPRASS